MLNSLTAGGRGGVRRGLATVLALLVAAVAALGLTAGSASAHSGGKAIALVERFELAPAATGYTARAVLADYDGGGALRAVEVLLTGAGFTKPTPMVESATFGTYTLEMPKAVPGPVSIQMKIDTIPGGTPVTAFSETYPGTLEAGKTTVLASAKGGGGGGGGSTGMIVGIAGAVLLVAVLYGLFSMRKKSAVPAPSK